MRLAPAKQPTKTLMQNTHFLDNQFQAGAGNQDKAMAGTLEEVALSANKRLVLKMSLSFHLS